MILSGVACFGEGAQGSAFYPRVSSWLSPSFLADNETYNISDPKTPIQGISVPFQNWHAIKSSAIELFSPGNPRRALFQYSHRDSSFSYAAEANIFTGFDQRWEDDGDYGLLYLGLRVNSVFNERIRARAVFWNGKFSGDLDAAHGSPLIDGGNVLSPSGTFLDNVNGELSYRGEHFSAGLGRGRFQIGNSISGSVVFSDRVNEYDYFTLEEQVGQFRFSLLHTTLQADSLDTVSGKYPSKYAAIHQITWQPKDHLRLFYGETVIYGNRIDLSYLLPANYWRVQKYNINDRDNLALYGGIDAEAAKNLSLYATLLIDELTVRKLFTNWWGNKYAFQAGTSLRMPAFKVCSADAPRFGLEFTAVRPWTYTHYANVSMYSHDARPLGYPKGSNLLDLTAELNVPLPGNIRWDSRFSYTWQGSEGNDWRLNYHEFFPPEITGTAEAHWLEGDLTKTAKWENTLRIGIMAHHSLLLGHSSEFGGNGKHQFFGGWQASF
jgi:hypothetical protein